MSRHRATSGWACASTPSTSSSRPASASRPLSWSLLLGLVLAERGLARIGNLYPLRVGLGARLVAVVPVPPLVRRRLRITLRRIFPNLLSAERCDVEVAPGGSERLIAADIDEIGAKDLLAVAEEHVVAVPFIDAEVFIEAVGDRVPRDVPAHARFQARDVRLRCARSVGKGGV